MEVTAKKKEKRVFVNNLDCYESLNIAKWLSSCVAGASLGDAEEEEEEEEEEREVKVKEGTFYIIGTAKDKLYKKPAYVGELLQYETKEDLFDHFLECDVIIYNINDDPDSIDEAIWALSGIHAALETVEKAKIFILVSSVMTWARSKPLDPEDPDIPFTEEEYRRRKPHPNFKEHCSAEKTVVKLGKKNKAKLATYVVASGLTYGLGEKVFHYFFRSAWHNATELLCFGEGENVLPTIHINHLAQVMQNIIDSRPKVRYMVAVDDSKHTMEEIVKTISSNLGSKKIRKVRKEEALLNKHLEQSEFDQLTIDLRMEATYVKESMNIKKNIYETGIVENIAPLVKEYKEERNLQPLKIFIHGPPACGKTTIAKQLALHYKLHHIKIQDVIEETTMKLERLVAKAEQEPEEGEEEEEEEGLAAEAADLLEVVKDQMANQSGRIDDQYVIKFFRDKLLTKPCQNQGFIIEGFPKTRDQASELFAASEDAEEEEADSTFNKKLMPEFIIALDATDEFLKERVMNLPERVVQGTHHTEEGLVRRLTEFRQNNTEDDTNLNYFDELEVHPENIELTNDLSEMHRNTVEKIKLLVGEPRNYGPTKEEQEEHKRLEEEARITRETAEKTERERLEADEKAERVRRQLEWAEKLETIRREEHDMLEAQSIPLRNYLMKHVMPNLSKALIECVKAKPEDSMDFIAEYLFTHDIQVD